jgi:hypothetical protein
MWRPDQPRYVPVSHYVATCAKAGSIPKAPAEIPSWPGSRVTNKDKWHLRKITGYERATAMSIERL